MPEIETREALITWLSREFLVYRSEAEALLNVLDDAGLVVCPKKPTTEMMEAAVMAETDQIAAAIAASPFAQTKGESNGSRQSRFNQR